MRSASMVGALLALVLIDGCAPAGRAPSSSRRTDEGRPWQALAADQKNDYMRRRFSPTLKARFLAFDPHRYAKMGCTPCHADDSTPQALHMPNVDLRLPVWGCHGEDDGSPVPVEMVDDALDNFMREEVVPLTARLLGRPVTSPTTPNGLGCFTCHGVDR